VKRAAAFICISLLVGGSLAGCRPRKPKPPSPPKQTSPSEIPKQINTQGIRINWRVKQPTGKLWRVLDLKAEKGTVESGTQSGVMTNAAGTLYKENKARAEFEAPTVEATRDQKVVVATGGVKLTSIDPKGVLVTADKATWYIEKNVVVAEGHVYLEQRSPKTNQKVAWGNTERLTINTELQKFSIP
jgi:lipopolysaccharide assembly outer membrane protein LptD (OstA)